MFFAKNKKEMFTDATLKGFGSKVVVLLIVGGKIGGTYKYTSVIIKSINELINN